MRKLILFIIVQYSAHVDYHLKNINKQTKIDQKTIKQMIKNITQHMPDFYPLGGAFWDHFGSPGDPLGGPWGSKGGLKTVQDAPK